MTLQERLRDNTAMHDERIAAADALDAKEKRIKELDGALRWIIAESYNTEYEQAALRIAERAREALK